MKHCAGSRGESAEHFQRNNGAPEKNEADGAERGYPLTSEKQAAIAVALERLSQILKDTLCSIVINNDPFDKMARNLTLAWRQNSG